jgi:hypothetical protein
MEPLVENTIQMHLTRNNDLDHKTKPQPNKLGFYKQCTLILQQRI